MNTQTVQIGDLIFYVGVSQKDPNMGRKVKSFGLVTHLGNILDNGFVETFIVKGGRQHEIDMSAPMYRPPNRLVAIPPREQWPEKMLEYIQTLPAAIQEQVLVGRGIGGALHLVDRETLLQAWVKMSMIEEANFRFDPSENSFMHGKPSIEVPTVHWCSTTRNTTFRAALK